MSPITYTYFTSLSHLSSTMTIRAYEGHFHPWMSNSWGKNPTKLIKISNFHSIVNYITLKCEESQNPFISTDNSLLFQNTHHNVTKQTKLKSLYNNLAQPIISQLYFKQEKTPITIPYINFTISSTSVKTVTSNSLNYSLVPPESTSNHIS